MFTSLRSRLWLSYALLITVALTIVSIVLFVFLIRNPLLTRQTQQQLKTVQNLLAADPQAYLKDLDSLQKITQEHDVRVLVFNQARKVILDSKPEAAALPYPRRNMLGRNSQTAVDSKGNIWLYASTRLTDKRVLVVAAPRPRVPIVNVFADQFLLPIVEGGVIAFLFSLVLAYMLSRWVADPLQQVVAAARNYPSEQMKPVKPYGPHEVQDLTRAFNSMIARVDSSQQSQRDFVANVSHELKTPLTSIQGLARSTQTSRADHLQRVRADAPHGARPARLGAFGSRHGRLENVRGGCGCVVAQYC
jgi:signal transduction histidine kinase